MILILYFLAFFTNLINEYGVFGPSLKKHWAWARARARARA